MAAAFITPGHASDAGRDGPRIVKRALARGARAARADKACDSEGMVALRVKSGAEAVIPSKANRWVPRSRDKEKYKERNRVERFFRRLKERRRLCLRTDNLARVFMSWAWLASIKDGLSPGGIS